MSCAERALRWMLSDYTGASSKNMLLAHMGMSTTRDYPHDLFDLQRCVILLNEVPEIRNSFDAIASINDEWRSIINEWDTIIDLYMSDCDGDIYGIFFSEKTTKALRSAIYR